MSGYYNNSASVAEIYKSVINDVINQVKESFLDENVDVDVLAQLKRDWEEKVNTSGCVELEARNMMQQHQVPPPPMRQGPSGMSQPRPMPIAVTRMPSGAQQVQGIIQHPGHPVNIHMEAGQRQQQVQMQYMQQQLAQGLPGQHVQAVALGGNIPPINGQAVFPQGVRVVQMANGQQQFIPNAQPMMMVGANGQPLQQLPFALQQNVAMQQIRAQQQPQMQHHHQLDGNSPRDEVEDEADQPGSSQQRMPTKAEAKNFLMQLFEHLSLDGGGGGMSDSSSEDEEEENDPLRRIADKIGGDGAIDEGETIVEEDPLNSEDDDQDDEDLETIFDADHVIMCLFEKVHRARNKWKFQLKDGVMNINNRDYCFQKCTGDAEW